MSDSTDLLLPPDLETAGRSWVPRHVLVTRTAADLPHAQQIITRCEAAGVQDITLLDGDRLPNLRAGSEREVYARAKQTLAVVVAPPSALRPQPIPPSADWRLDLARGCPAHCQYCYLAGSLQGPPITRVYANLNDVLAPIPELAGRGNVTTGDARRGGEGTTFELSCYTDPLGLEAVTGSLSAAVARVGRGEYGDGVGLRFTTKFDNAAPLIGLPHGGRTRVRLSVNSAAVSRRFEGGTAPVRDRLAALRALARDGYPVGLTIAPIMPLPDWQADYGSLLQDITHAVADVADLDLSVELITHRFTEASREVLLSWYPPPSWIWPRPAAASSGPSSAARSTSILRPSCASCAPGSSTSSLPCFRRPACSTGPDPLGPTVRECDSRSSVTARRAAQAGPGCRR